MEMNNLKKEEDALFCPFCGSSEIYTYQYQHEAGPRYAIACMNCMAGIDPGYAQNRHTVLNMWNRRKSSVVEQEYAKWINEMYL